MATTTDGFFYPELLNPPLIPTHIQALADSVQAWVDATYGPVAARVAASALLPQGINESGARHNDIRCTQSDRTTLITKTITIPAGGQWVLIGGKARFDSDPTASGTGTVGLGILVAGALPDQATAGPVDLTASGESSKKLLAIPLFPVLMTAGDHDVVLQADRDSGGVVNARGDLTLNGRNYTSTTLTIWM